MTWASNGLVWLTAGAVVVLAAIPPAAIALIDHRRTVPCAAPKTDVKAGAVMALDDLTLLRVHPDAAPHDRVSSKDVVGQPAIKDLRAQRCIARSALKADPLSFTFDRAAVRVMGSPVTGKAVDLLFAPINGQDSRDGATVERTPVLDSDSGHIVVGVTKEQQKTIVKYLGRSIIIIRAT